MTSFAASMRVHKYWCRKLRYQPGAAAAEIAILLREQDSWPPGCPSLPEIARLSAAVRQRILDELFAHVVAMCLYRYGL